MGRILIPMGILSSATGLWMNQFNDLPPHDGLILYIERLVFGFLMLLSLVLGYFAIMKRDFINHKSWMMRAYAIGLGAGTQVLTNMPWMLLVGEPNVPIRAFLMGAGWVINLAIAEYIIRRPIPSHIK